MCHPQSKTPGTVAGVSVKNDPQRLLIPEEYRVAGQTFTLEDALAGINEIRRLHVELDRTLLPAYGWDLPS
jgi:hypothetical protein